MGNPHEGCKIVPPEPPQMLLLLTWIRQIEFQWPKFIAHISQRSTTLQKCSVCSIGPQFPLNLTKCRSWTFTNHKRSGRNQRLAMSISSSVYSHWLLLHESPPLLLPLFAGPLTSFTSLPPFSFSATMLSSTTHQCSAAPLHQLSPPSSWYPIPQNQTTLPPCIPSTFSFSLHTNEDKISRHSSIEATRLTLISGASVHTNCTTTMLLFGHPMFGHRLTISRRHFKNVKTIFFINLHICDMSKLCHKVDDMVAF